MKDLKEIAKFIGESVDALLDESATNCRLKLDDKLAIFVGWSVGYGDEIRDDVIQSPEDPDWGINAGIKVWTSDDLWTDYDMINFPYYEDGDVLDMSLSVEEKDKEDGYITLAKDLLKWYDEVKDLDIEEDGKINEPVAAVDRNELDKQDEPEDKEIEEESLKENYQNSEYRTLIAEYFNYSVDFDFLNVVCDAIDGVEDFTNDDDIYEAIDNSLIYYSDQWCILEHYCTPQEANWDDAYEEFVVDILSICREIQNQKKGEEE